jgi:putative transposase
MTTINDSKPHPRTPKRLDRLYISTPLYFITCCTQNRARLLANECVLQAFCDFSRSSNQRRGIAVGRFVIMPDHVHFFVRMPPDLRLSSWVGLLKQKLSIAICSAGDSIKPIWQRGFFDHVLRNSESYAEKWAYVWSNPVRAGLVEKAESWPYSGEIVLIDRV